MDKLIVETNFNVGFIIRKPNGRTINLPPCKYADDCHHQLVKKGSKYFLIYRTLRGQREYEEDGRKEILTGSKWSWWYNKKRWNDCR